jgi:hypothetical protein
MRPLATGLILLIIVTILVISCKKHNNPTLIATLQHRWQIVSLNGEAFRYVGKPADYWDFRTNDTLIQSINGTNDTVQYKLDNAGKVLNISTFAFSITANIKTFTNTQLILAGTSQGGYVNSAGNILDSLSR